VGLYRAAGGAAIRRYDDVKSGYDGDDEGDRRDAGGEMHDPNECVARRRS
jgi:hypothetical protein